MRDVLDAMEIAALMGAAFSFALLVEWAALRAFFKALTAGRKPAVSEATLTGVREARH